MDSIATKTRSPGPDLWTIIRQWPARAAAHAKATTFNGDAKLGWLYVFELAGCRVEHTVVFHIQALAASIGSTERVARRCIEATLYECLWQLIDRKKGLFTVYQRDPRIVARGRLVSACDSGQGELFATAPEELRPGSGDDQDGRPRGEATLPLRRPDGDPADLLTNPPADSAPNPPFQHLDTLNTLRESFKHPTLTRVETAETEHFPPEREEAKRAADRAAKDEAWQLRELARRDAQARRESLPSGREPASIHGAMETIIRRMPTPAEQEKQVAELAGHLARSINDPVTLESTYRRIAWAVCEGLFKKSILDNIVRSVHRADREGKIRATRGMFFMGCIKDAFRKAGIDWRGQA